ncbi:MAG: hypothetical protein ACREMH_09895 [Gemmatimonadales bacterium]
MTRSRLAEFLLWIAIVMAGIVLGASVYQRIALIPEWGGYLPQSVIDYFGGTTAAAASGRFWTRFLPPTGLVLLLTLVAGWPDRQRRPWLALAFGLYLAAMVWTALWFIPEGVVPLMQQAGAGMTPDEISSRARTWIFLDWFRTALALGFLLALLQALTLRRAAPRVA